MYLKTLCLMLLLYAMFLKILLWSPRQNTKHFSRKLEETHRKFIQFAETQLIIVFGTRRRNSKVAILNHLSRDLPLINEQSSLQVPCKKEKRLSIIENSR